jgi:hypothetical protein
MGYTIEMGESLMKKIIKVKNICCQECGSFLVEEPKVGSKAWTIVCPNKFKYNEHDEKHTLIIYYEDNKTIY